MPSKSFKQAKSAANGTKSKLHTPSLTDGKIEDHFGRSPTGKAEVSDGQDGTTGPKETMSEEEYYRWTTVVPRRRRPSSILKSNTPVQGGGSTSSKKVLFQVGGNDGAGIEGTPPGSLPKPTDFPPLGTAAPAARRDKVSPLPKSAIASTLVLSPQIGLSKDCFPKGKGSPPPLSSQGGEEEVPLFSSGQVGEGLLCSVCNKGNGVNRYGDVLRLQHECVVCTMPVHPPLRGCSEGEEGLYTCKNCISCISPTPPDEEEKHEEESSRKKEER